MYLYKLPNVFVFAMQPVTRQGGPEFGQIFCYNLPASPNLVTILHLQPIDHLKNSLMCNRCSNLHPVKMFVTWFKFPRLTLLLAR